MEPEKTDAETTEVSEIKKIRFSDKVHASGELVLTKCEQLAMLLKDSSKAPSVTARQLEALQKKVDDRLRPKAQLDLGL